MADADAEATRRAAAEQERRLAETLQPDLKRALARRDGLAAQLEEWHSLRCNLAALERAVEMNPFTRHRPAITPVRPLYRPPQHCVHCACRGTRNLRRVQSGSRQLRTRVDLGSDVQMQAHVPDASRVLLAAGAGVWVELTLAEAPAAIAIHEASLRRRIAAASARVAAIRTHVKLTLHALDALGATAAPPGRGG